MEANKYIRLAGIAYESLVNGPGIRRVLFAQGCRHNCKGCFNTDTHNFNGGQLKEMDEIIKDITENKLLRGVTFSGGDPLEQGEEFAYLASKLKKIGMNIWCYTGYTFEYILENVNMKPGWQLLIKNIDVLVDGKFQEENMDARLNYRGSSNQRLIDVPKSLAYKNVQLIEID